MSSEIKWNTVNTIWPDIVCRVRLANVSWQVCSHCLTQKSQFNILNSSVLVSNYFFPSFTLQSFGQPTPVPSHERNGNSRHVRKNLRDGSTLPTGMAMNNLPQEDNAIYISTVEVYDVTLPCLFAKSMSSRCHKSPASLKVTTHLITPAVAVIPMVRCDDIVFVGWYPDKDKRKDSTYGIYIHVYINMKVPKTNQFLRYAMRSVWYDWDFMCQSAGNLMA